MEVVMKDKNRQVMRTDLFTEFGQFFVSTAYRRSSAALNPDGWYYETFGWKVENNKRTDWVADHSGASFLKMAIKQHNEVCKQLLLNGKFREGALNEHNSSTTKMRFM